MPPHFDNTIHGIVGSDYVCSHCPSLQVRQMVQKDSRIKLVSEVLNGIKVWVSPCVIIRALLL